MLSISQKFNDKSHFDLKQKTDSNHTFSITKADLHHSILAFSLDCTPALPLKAGTEP
jgi:hypothetical protein